MGLTFLRRVRAGMACLLYHGVKGNLNIGSANVMESTQSERKVIVIRIIMSRL
jgi:hypothetical protein